MANYLVVAHQTAASLELIRELKLLAGAGEDAEFVLLVPATPVHHLLTWQEEGAEQVAQKRSAEAEAALELAGHTLEKAGLIEHKRSLITIVDPQGLEQAACECYAVIRAMASRAD